MHLQWVTSVICKLYLNKAAKKEEEEEEVVIVDGSIFKFAVHLAGVQDFLPYILSSY